MEYSFDAKNKILGRLATEIAVILAGKNTPAYTPSSMPAVTVRVVNVEKVRVTGRKLKDKLYRRHSGYHGGLKEETLERVLERDPRRALEHAIVGMLPKNKLRPRMMKNLILIKGEK